MKQILKKYWWVGTIIVLLAVVGAVGARWWQSLPVQVDMPRDLTRYRLEQDSLNVDGIEMKYVETGEGKDLVLVHGVPTSGQIYSEVIYPLSKQYRVIVPDMPGFGASELPAWDQLSFEAQGRRLGMLLTELGVQDATVVVHDAGGIWTWEMMEQYPDMVDEVIMLNTPIVKEYFHPPMPLLSSTLRHGVDMVMQSAKAQRMMVEDTMLQGVLGDYFVNEDVAVYLYPVTNEGKGAAIHWFYMNIKEKREELDAYVALLKERQMPITIIWGTEDPILRFEGIDVLREKLSGQIKGIYTIRDSGHFVMLDTPEVILSVLLK